MNLATWVDEVAYRHFEHAQTLENSPEYERAMLRANRLKGYAVMLGERNYSYWQRLEYEETID